MALTEPIHFFPNQSLHRSLYRPKENFHIHRKLNQESNFLAAVTYLPKDNPRKPRGEDAHFICAAEKTIGVADGVGGWVLKGIDSGQYARDLMTNCAIAVHREPKGDVNPKRVMCEAYSNTRVEGSSTACIVSLSGNVLLAANVGDSGFLIIRDGKAIYLSPVQQHSFNFPYQLGIKRDGPSIADEFEVPVEIGDVVVVGTDGLFDNMEVAEIEKTLRQDNPARTISPGEMACRIANLALYNSFNRYSETPFSRKSKKAGNAYRGGKIDDITVIVAYVQAVHRNCF